MNSTDAKLVRMATTQIQGLHNAFLLPRHQMSAKQLAGYLWVENGLKWTKIVKSQVPLNCFAMSVTPQLHINLSR